MSDDQAKSKDPPAVAANIPPKLSRPLTCYGIFSVLERNLIWQQNEKPSTTTSNDGDEDATTDPYAATRPQRYQLLVLPPNWYMAGINRKKRAEHKIHGKITFQEMTKSIAEKWRTVDAETRDYCEIIANQELARHKREVAAYKKRYGEEAFKAQQTSSSKSKEKRKHEPSEAKAEGSDYKIADTSVAIQSNNSNEDSNNIETTNPAEGTSCHSTDTIITSHMINNSNQQANFTTNTDNFNAQFNNKISAAFAAASHPNYVAENTFETAYAAAVRDFMSARASASFTHNLNNTIGTTYSSFSQPQLPSDQFSAVHANSLTEQLYNVWTAYAAAQQLSDQRYNTGMAFPTASVPDYTRDFIRSMMELQSQNQCQGLAGLAELSSQLYTAQFASNKAMGPEFQGQRLLDLPDNRSDAFELVGNNENIYLSKDESDKTSDSNEERDCYL